MKEQLEKTWSINQKMNELVLNNISEEGLNKSLNTRGGRSIRQQFIHIHNVRLQWLEICAKELAAGYKQLEKEAIPDQKQLLNALAESAKGIAALLSRSWDEGGKLKNFKTGLIPFVGYLISHESHHRGNILLTLKQTGEKIPDAVKWGLWEWGK